MLSQIRNRSFLAQLGAVSRSRTSNAQNQQTNLLISLLAKMAPSTSWTGSQFFENSCRHCNQQVHASNLTRKMAHLQKCPKFLDHFDRLQEQDEALQRIPEDTLKELEMARWIRSKSQSNRCFFCGNKVGGSMLTRRSAHLKNCPKLSEYIENLWKEENTVALEQIPLGILRCHKDVRPTQHPEVPVDPLEEVTLATRSNEDVDDSVDDRTLQASSGSTRDVDFRSSLVSGSSPCLGQADISTQIEVPTLNPEPWHNMSLLQQSRTPRYIVHRDLELDELSNALQ
jgi:hypothetical protein